MKLTDTILILRFSRLGRLPPALSATEMLLEAGYPLLVVEYGNEREERRFIPGALPKMRFECAWARLLPPKLRPAVIWAWSALQLFALLVRRGRPRMIVAHGLSEQALVWIVTRVVRVPYLVHVHEVFRWRELKGFNRVLFLLESVALRDAAQLVFPEKTRSDIYRRRYGLANPIAVVYNCPRRQARHTPLDLHRDLQIPAQGFLIGYFGGLGEHNALEEAIRAVARVPNAYFILWGWGDKSYVEHLKRVAAGAGTSHRVRWPGQLPAEKWETLAALDATYCVYTPTLLRLRYGATASNKLMESYAVGVPALAGTGMDFKFWVEHYQTGVYVHEAKADAIAESIRYLIADRARSREMGNRAFAMHREWLNFDKQYQPVVESIQARFPISKKSDTDAALPQTAIR